METSMSSRSDWTKVPQVTLAFWIIKILATTLGETAGDAVTMTLGLGYLVGTATLRADDGRGSTSASQFWHQRKRTRNWLCGHTVAAAPWPISC
jgi:Repeat of Unknown Function (DUF347)